MAEVYLASTSGPAGVQKLLVIKQLKRGQEDERELITMFLDEARIALRLAHPNVVQTYEVDVDDGLPFIAMEYLEGQPLHRVLRRYAEHGGLPRDTHLWILAELLAGLHHAHELCDYDGRPLHVVHRDVNPQNVVITYHGGVKLMDFGIAKAMDSVATTDVGMFKGKLAYMAPEQARGGEVDRRADVFAVGVMIWEALAGQRMWAGRTDIEIATALHQGWVPPLPADTGIPPALRSICERAVALDPDQRWPDGQAMLEALHGWLVAHGQVPSPSAFGRELSERFAVERERRAMLVQRLGPAAAVPLEPWADEPVARPDDETRRITPPLPVGIASVLPPSSSPAAAPPREPRLPRRSPAPRWALAALLTTVGLGLAANALSRPEPEPEPVAAPPSPPPLAPTSAVASPPSSSACARSGPAVELTGDIEGDATLSCSTTYLLRYTTRVRPGATLTIEPGTVLLGDAVTKGMLVVQPGARLLAEGRPDAPIVFTSAKPPDQRRPGDWGGLLVLGRAPVNLRDHAGIPMLGDVEGLHSGGRYGGDDPDDDSGVIRYVRIEYSGIELAPNNEVNGLTLAGVGRGTRLDHVQVRHAADDCFEMFGGTVDGHHLLCDDPGDDAFDWDLGYQGTLRFLAVRSARSENGQHGMEGDNDPQGDRAEPRSRPRVANVTLCGPGSDAPGERYGLLLRRGTDVRVERAVVVGFDAALDVRDAATSFEVLDSILAGATAPSAILERQGAFGPLADDDGNLDEAALLLQPTWRNATHAPGLPTCTGPGIEGLLPTASLVLPGVPGEPGSDYAGAFRDRDDRWDRGWATWDDER